MKRKYYIYAYLDTRIMGTFTYENYTFNFEPFYIGKGFGNRLYQHLKLLEESNPFKNAIIKKIYKENKEPIIIKIIDNIQNEQKAFILERDIINCIGRRDKNLGPLTNLTDGGEGASGLIFTKEQRKKMGLRKKKLFLGSGNPFYGKHHTIDAKKRISNIHKGKLLTDEHKKKITQFLKNGYGDKNGMFGIVGAKNSKAKKYEIVDPNGNIHTIYGTIEYDIKQFCDTHDISKRSLYRTLQSYNYKISRGKTKGWKLRYVKNTEN